MSNKITLLPDYIDITQLPSVEFYNNATNLMSAFSTYTGELSVCIDFEKSKVSPDVITSTANLYKKLNETSFKIQAGDITYAFDDIFKLFYIEKFQSLGNSLKTLLTSSFSGSNIFFNNYSDDTGNITNITSIIDNNTSPYFDSNDILFNSPNSIAASLYNKISINELTTSINMSVLTDAILKVSMKGLQNNVTLDTAKTAHGENLITDNLYINRVYSYSDTINSQLKNIIGDMADFIKFFKNVNYRDQDESRQALFLMYKINIEHVEVKIDILKNKLDKSIPNTLDATQSVGDASPTRAESEINTVIL
jgi:hypothetical protein